MNRLEISELSPTNISEIISIKLADYEWALKKHGIQSTLGELSGVLDPKFLSASAAAIASLSLSGNQKWAALGGAGLLIGKVAVSIAKIGLDIVDTKRGESCEVAYLYAIKKRFKKS